VHQHRQFEDNDSLERLLDALFNSFDCDDSGHCIVQYFIQYTMVYMV
jgi:hypothetical protein